MLPFLPVTLLYVGHWFRANLAARGNAVVLNWCIHAATFGDHEPLRTGDSVALPWPGCLYRPTCRKPLLASFVCVCWWFAILSSLFWVFSWHDHLNHPILRIRIDAYFVVNYRAYIELFQCHLFGYCGSLDKIDCARHAFHKDPESSTGFLSDPIGGSMTIALYNSATVPKRSGHLSCLSPSLVTMLCKDQWTCSHFAGGMHCRGMQVGDTQHLV